MATSNQPSNPKYPAKRSFGERIELDTQRYLETQGLKLIQTNFNCKLGEIDLIMREKDTVVFVEVRYRKSTAFGSGAETVTLRKQLRLIKTAHFFLLKKPMYASMPCRFDVVSVQPATDSTYNEFNWIPNAFGAYS